MTDRPVALPQDRRRYPRTLETAPASIVVGAWPQRQSYDCVVHNLSDTGAAIESKHTPLTIGQTAQLKIRSASYTLTGTIVRNGIPHQYGLRFSTTLPEQIRTIEALPRKILAGIGIVVLAVAVCLFKIQNFVSFWYAPFLETYSLLAAGFVLSRAALSMMYREPKDQGYLPTVSIIIAAKNEEGHIAETLHHSFQSRYPAEKLEIIAIDDGSTDKTWNIMASLTDQYPQLKNFRFEKNLGKRHAMSYGAKMASGEILIYVDSDSYVEPEAVYRIVQPFIDRKIGAVSGHILVVEEADNFISKMEAARYYISHRIMKAAESVFGAVTCCPGAFSAYRKSAVLRVLPAWLDQKFLGTQATFGDDRSLTNYILRTHKVIYHAGARCATYVPNGWRKFFTQQLRWKKSWSRETTVAMRLMYRKHPVAVLSYYASILLTVLSPLMVLRALVYLPLTGSPNVLPYLVGLFLVYTFLCLFYCFHTQSKTWYYGLAFACLYVSFLCFQNYYAILTVRQNHWGTR